MIPLLSAELISWVTVLNPSHPFLIHARASLSRASAWANSAESPAPFAWK
jgi:hypothetical protein